MGQKEKYLLRFIHLYLVHRLSWCRSIYFLSQCIEKCVSERLATAAVVDKVLLIKSCGGLIFFMKNLRFGLVQASLFLFQISKRGKHYVCLYWLWGFCQVVGCYAHLFSYFMMVKLYLKKSLWPQFPPTIAVVLQESRSLKDLCYDWFTEPNTLLATIPGNLPKNLLHFCSASGSSSSCIIWAFIKNWLSCGQKLYCKYTNVKFVS